MTIEALTTILEDAGLTIDSAVSVPAHACPLCRPVGETMPSATHDHPPALAA